MALDTYANLQTAVLNWIMRPGDALVSPSVPDMILLFEEEARDRLKTRFNETTATLSTVAGTATVAQPTMFEGLREAVLQTTPTSVLTYMTPEQADEEFATGGNNQPVVISSIGQNFKLYPTPDAVYSIAIDYMQGIPALSGGAPSNWLLANYPSLYLFGTLAEAEAFIGEDERIAMWIQRRDAAFARVAAADRLARWSGSSLQIKTDTGNP